MPRFYDEGLLAPVQQAGYITTPRIQTSTRRTVITAEVPLVLLSASNQMPQYFGLGHDRIRSNP